MAGWRVLKAAAACTGGCKKRVPAISPSAQLRAAPLLPPVVGTDGVGHRGICRVWDEPLEVLAGAQADGGPVLRLDIVTVGVEVSQEEGILPGERIACVCLALGWMATVPPARSSPALC